MAGSVATVHRGSSKRILLVDDHLPWTTVLSEVITHLDPDRYEVDSANSGAEGLECMRRRTYDLVFLDLNMGDTNGMAVLREARSQNLARRYVLMSAEDKVRNAVDALQQGASDFLVKPFGREHVLGVLTRLLPPDEEGPGASDPRIAWRDTYAPGIIGTHPALLEVLLIMERIASTNATVLITGEPGTGKELVARAVHRASPRHKGQFLPLNVTATSETLFESTLFGWSKNAFTGAGAERPGFFEEANDGTVFLDEIGELPLHQQPKLLRVLQTGSFNRMGEVKERHSNARVVSATNRNLAQLVKQGQFREDLFWRLNVIPIRLPPLRERATDIPLLAEHFLNDGARKHGCAQLELSDEVKQWMTEQPWHGNIRQLEHTINRICLLHRDSPLLRLEDVIPYVSHDPMLPDAQLLGAVPESIAPIVRPAQSAFFSAPARSETIEKIPDTPVASAPPELTKLSANAAPTTIHELAPPRNEAELLDRITLPAQGIDLKKFQKKLEAKLIWEALKSKNFVRAHAAVMLGVGRTTLVEKIRKLAGEHPELVQEEPPDSPS